jgi:hypothetical protein
MHNCRNCVYFNKAKPFRFKLLFFNQSMFFSHNKYINDVYSFDTNNENHLSTFYSVFFASGIHNKQSTDHDLRECIRAVKMYTHTFRCYVRNVFPIRNIIQNSTVWAVFPNVCSADHWWSTRLAKWSANICKHLHFVLREALKWP